jgi:HPt (histidine-containing phosphotransfer) domain-containing protein
VDGDAALLSEMVGVFEAECPRQLDALRRALEASDAGALQAAAHSFKGAVGNFSAPVVASRAATLERLAQAGDLREAADVLRTLEAEARDLQHALRALPLLDSPGLP